MINLGNGKYRDIELIDEAFEKAKEYDNFKKFNKIEDMFEFMNTFNKYKEKAKEWDGLFGRSFITVRASPEDIGRNLTLQDWIKHLEQDNKQLQRDYSHLLKQKKDCEDSKYIMEQKLKKVKEWANQSPYSETNELQEILKN